MAQSNITPPSADILNYCIAKPVNLGQISSLFQHHRIEIEASAVSGELLCMAGTRAAVGRKEILIATSGSKVVAAIRIYRRKTVPRISVYQFAVDVEYRGRGIIRRLLEECGTATFEVRCPKQANINTYFCSTGWTEEESENEQSVWILQ